MEARSRPGVDAVLGDALEVLRIVTLLVESGDALDGRRDLAAARARRRAERRAAPRRRGVGRVPRRPRVERATRCSPGAVTDGAAMDDGRRGWTDAHCHLQGRYRPTRATAAPRPRGAGRTRRRRRRCGRLAGAPSRRRGRGHPGGVRRDDRDVAVEAVRAITAGTSADLPQVYATVGLHPHEASTGTDGVALLDRGPGATGSWRSGSAGSTTTTSTRRATPSWGPCASSSASASRQDLAVVLHVRDAFDDLFDVLETSACRRGRSCTASGRAPPRPALRRGGHGRLGRGDRHVQERDAAPRGARRGARSSGCWSRPTARSSRRCRIAGGRTSRRSSRSSARPSPRTLNSTSRQRLRAATTLNASRVFSLPDPI